MPERLPFAAMKFQELRQDELVDRGQAVVDGLLAAIAIYPTPPVLPAALQILVDNYSAALAGAVLGGKYNTKAKDNTKFLLINALRVDASYVNQLTYNLNASGTSYAVLRANVTLTGYELSKDPIPPAPLSAPENFRAKSLNPGEIYFACDAVKNYKCLQIEYRSVTPTLGELVVFASPRVRGIITGLTKGVQYQLQCVFVGASPVKNYSNIIYQVCI